MTCHHLSIIHMRGSNTSRVVYCHLELLDFQLQSFVCFAKNNTLSSPVGIVLPEFFSFFFQGLFHFEPFLFHHFRLLFLLIQARCSFFLCSFEIILHASITKHAPNISARKIFSRNKVPPSLHFSDHGIS